MVAGRPEPAIPRRTAGGFSERARAVLDALEHLVGGLGTALLAFVAMAWVTAVTLLCAAGIGLLLAPSVPHAVRAVAARERARLSRWGPEIIGPGPPPARARDALADTAVRRELCWVFTHGTAGLAFSAFAITLPISAVQDITYPLWWRLLPPPDTELTGVSWTVTNTSDALLVTLLGLALAAVFVLLAPAMARLQAWPGRHLLAATADTDLSLRIAQLSATRAAALDAHATELRRIERSLHDGAQNRLVGVTVLLGATHRALTRDPAHALAILERAQDAAEQALAELRTVVRSILPPVLDDHGLPGALAGLAANCAVPCQIDIDLPGRCAASVEATAYFVTAEALTNISRHSRARHAQVTVRRHGPHLHLQIQDDGTGGAEAGGKAGGGTGIAGIRSRIHAHDGHLTLTSPPGGPTTLKVQLPCGS
ncbi:sensor histidine kinase [Actinomadura soli]|uniref:Oxygen sensor histidine kinase NreB n=1 Tax=Actinomadura soli TaxID=2508997 RepID=A0A5C4JGG4_9ACTN|nr:sensor histidine kinase [Actinomadura soli]TMR04332.1 sensor histidine kinase [Actinomadura soli]